jgi:hypothetical protein
MNLSADWDKEILQWQEVLKGSIAPPILMAGFIGGLLDADRYPRECRDGYRGILDHHALLFVESFTANHNWCRSYTHSHCGSLDPKETRCGSPLQRVTKHLWQRGCNLSLGC